MSANKVYEIKLSEIEISDLNVRHGNATKNIDELAASIKRHGLLQPVSLIGDFGNPPYQLIAGQRRFLAHEKLNKTTIRAIFTGTISDEEATLLSLVENMTKVDLNHADSARAITQLYEAYGKSDRKVQRETGLSLRRIRDYLTIESQASQKMKRMLRDRKVTPADVKRALKAALGQTKKAEKLLDLMCEYPLTKHEKKRVVEYGEEHSRASAETILKEARRPRVEKSIIVSLPEDVRSGLEQATTDLQQEAEEIVAEVLYDWLFEQGFLNE